MSENDPIARALTRRGISDAHAYLEKLEASGNLVRSPFGQVTVQGNVHIMMGRTLTKKRLEEREKALEHV